MAKGMDIVGHVEWP